MARGAMGGVAVVAVMVILGWVTDVASLRTLGGEVAVKFNTAVCLLAVVLPELSRHTAARVVCLGLVLAVAGAALIEYSFSIDFGLNELVVRDSTPGPNQAGRMSLPSAVGLSGVALASVARRLGRRRLSDLAASSVLVVAGLALLGYAYGAPALYTVGSFSTMALWTAICLALLALAELCLVEDGVLPWLCRSRDAGAVVLRRLLPFPLVVLPVVGYGRIRGQEGGLYDVRFGTALAVTVSGVMMVAVSVSAARRISRFDEERLRTVARVQSLNSMLSDRVHASVRDLHHERTLSSVLEDRSRLAADLNDRVLQRVFAAGMHLRGAVRRDPASPTAGRSQTVLDELDEAITELRGTILTLNRSKEDETLLVGIRSQAALAAEVLGFQPEVVISGDPSRVPPLVKATLLEVVHEALANIADHAGATSARIALEVTAELVGLTVADDGRTMPSMVPSGLDPIRLRAQDLGGVAEWSPTTESWTSPTSPTPSPGQRGTTLTWRVPLTTPAIRRLPQQPTRHPTAPQPASAMLRGPGRWDGPGTPP